MNLEQKKKYVFHLMKDIQHVRSVFYESNGGDSKEGKAACDAIGERLDPWLFGKQCILTTLEKLSNADEIDNGAILNLAEIARHNNGLRIVAINSKRHDPSAEEIWNI